MNQLRAGVVLNYVAIVLNMVIGLLYTPYLLRMLGQSEYGLYSLAASIIAYLTVLDLGFGNAIIRYTAKFRAEGKIEEQQYMFGMFFLLYLGIGVVAFIAGTILTYNVQVIFSKTMNAGEIERTRIMLGLMTFNLAFTFPMSIWGSIMSAYERFVFQRLVSIIRSVLNPLVMIVLLFIGYKAVALVVVTTLFNVATLIIHYWYCKRKLNIKIKFGRCKIAFLKEVSIYSFWVFLNAIMDRIYWSSGQFVLGIFCGAASIAVYAVAIQLLNMYMMFSTAISSVFLPKVTANVAQNNNEKVISNLFIRTGRLQYIVMALILTAFIAFGKPFIFLWAGSGYDDAYVISLLFFIPLTVPLIQNLGITILQARNQMKFRSLLYLFIAVGSLGISIPMAKYYGGIGCAIGISSALILGQILIMNIYYQRRQHLDIVNFWKQIFRMSFVPMLFVICYLCFHSQLDAWLICPMNFIIGVAVFLLAYIPLFWILGLNAEEKSLILSPLRRFQKNKLHDRNNQ